MILGIVVSHLCKVPLSILSLALCLFLFWPFSSRPFHWLKELCLHREMKYFARRAGERCGARPLLLHTVFRRLCGLLSAKSSSLVEAFPKAGESFKQTLAQGMSPVGGRVRNRGRGLLEVTRGCSRKGRIGRSQNTLFRPRIFLTNL